jgi:hypothetical protein
MAAATATSPRYRLDNPLAPASDANGAAETGLYADAIELGRELIERPKRGGGPDRVRVQHSKQRMTVFERLRVLSDREPNLTFQNWGPSLDGASIVTGILDIGGRDVAVYGHDFTLRAGSMDATNGAKLARLIYMAADRGIPLIGMNDSAGAFVPAGVGGLDGYSEAFTALRKISGRVPSISLMFGYNAGGGAYLPRQGSFVIQAGGTFIGLTGPGVVKSVLGEDVSAEDLGGPGVHGLNGVADITTDDELGALRTAIRLLGYLPNHNAEFAPFRPTSDPIDRFTIEEDILFRRTFHQPAGMNSPLDITLFMQQICDHGEYFELQPARARNLITAFGRIGGHVIGIVANNSAVASGPDRHRRRAQGHALHPLLQPLQHPADLPRGHDRLPARPRAGDGRHHPRGPPLPRLDHRRARAVDDADHPQRVRRRLRELQLALRRRRLRVHDADGADRGDGSRPARTSSTRTRSARSTSRTARRSRAASRRPRPTPRATRGSPRSPRATRRS